MLTSTLFLSALTLCVPSLAVPMPKAVAAASEELMGRGAPHFYSAPELHSTTPVQAQAQVQSTSQYPFSRVVAFGDNLSDNGNGSVAHGVAQQGDPNNKIYGFGTWTNGPVAVSYLSDKLNMPLLDYAFGHKWGGSKFGATIDNQYTASTADAPSSKDQIANYTGSDNVHSASDALHFLWIGANDINLYHIGTAVGSDNSGFAKEISTRMAAQVKSLLDIGAPAVFVPGLYAKHISPSKEFYASNPTEYKIMGDAIAQANTAIQSELAQFGDKVIYYDVYGKMLDIWNGHDSFGISKVGNWFCDGFSDLSWKLCVMLKQGSSFYWMQYLDMTSHVHSLIADDMFNVIQAHYSK